MATADGALVVDVHAHLYCPDVEPLIDGKQSPDQHLVERYSSKEIRDYRAKYLPTLRARLRSLPGRIESMDRMGVDMQVITPSPRQMYYWLDEADGIEAARIVNNQMAESVATNSKRFAAMGTLPMQTPDAAAKELVRLVEELGLRGVQINTRVNDQELSDPSLKPVWQAAEELGVPLWLHPLGFTHAERLAPFYMTTIIGQPLEEIIGLIHLVVGGVLDRHPKLKIGCLHGGGYFPYYLGRLDRTWETNPVLQENIDRPPSSYMSRIYFDTMVFRPDAVAHLIRLAGPDKVLMGTDYPYEIGEDDPIALIEGTEEASDEVKRKVLGGNAVELFGLNA